jgi:hypothetical protein
MKNKFLLPSRKMQTDIALVQTAKAVMPVSYSGITN